MPPEQQVANPEPVKGANGENRQVPEQEERHLPPEQQVANPEPVKGANGENRQVPEQEERHLPPEQQVANPEPVKGANGENRQVPEQEERHQFVAESEMSGVRKEFAPTFKMLVISVIVLIFISVVATLIVIFSGKLTEDVALFVRLIQITFGMILGASCIFLGVIVIWLGITAAYTVNARGKLGGASQSVNLQTASPGIILVISGAFLIGVSLYKEVHTSRTQEIIPGDPTVKVEDYTPAKNRP